MRALREASGLRPRELVAAYVAVGFLALVLLGLLAGGLRRRSE